YRGILTGFNEAFIIDGKKKDELIAQDPKSAEIIRPILRGRDIKRYGYDFADLWLINTHNGIKEKGIKPINIEHYPAIKKHLDQFYAQLEKRADKGDTPYNLRNCAYMEEFFKPKIIFQEMVQEPSFVYDKEGKFLCLDTARIITGDNIEYLLHILNSKLFFFAIKRFYGGGGLGDTGVRMKHTFFEQFSIPPLNKIIDYVRSNNTYNYQEINDLIYESIGLNKDEVIFIESQ